MPVFVYQGKLADGSNITGTIDASTEIEARIKLRAQKMIPIKVKEQRQAAASTSGMGLGAMLGFTPKVKSKDLQIFTRQLATMVAAGIPIVQSLEILFQ